MKLLFCNDVIFLSNESGFSNERVFLKENVY